MKHISTFSENSRNRTSLFPYLSLIITGVVIGSFMAESSAAELSFFNQYFVPSDNNMSVFVHIKGTFVWSAIFTGCVFCIGLCAIGKLLGILGLLYRGAGIGMSVSYVYASCGKESLLSVAAMLPKAVAFSVVAALSVREALRSSRNIFNYCMKGEVCNDNTLWFRSYCIKFIVLMILSLFISAADGGLNYVLDKVIQH